MAGQLPTGLTVAEGRKFALPVGTAFLLLAGIIWWRGHLRLATGFAVLGGLLVLAGLVAPARLGPVYRAWMGFALVLSKITTPIFMGIVFFLVMAPTGLLMRLFGKNPVARVPKDGSYWVARESGPGRSNDLKRQF